MKGNAIMKEYTHKNQKYVAGYEDEYVKIKERLEDTYRPCGEPVRNYICICKECGKEFHASHTMIRDHLASFCKDCKMEKKKVKKNKYYGTRIYSIWYSMKCRCYYKNHPFYNNYGGRGITVCDEWRFNSIAFGDWAVSHGYADNLTIDRIDNEKGYSPENCRWVTMKEQASNKREIQRKFSNKGKIIEINGEKKNLSDWCRYYQISKKTVEKRIYKNKWDVVEAITTPPRKRGN